MCSRLAGKRGTAHGGESFGHSSGTLARGVVLDGCWVGGQEMPNLRHGCLLGREERGVY